jgi:hypothetical protein
LPAVVIRSKDRETLRGSAGRPLRVVKMYPVSIQASPAADRCSA